MENIFKKQSGLSAVSIIIIVLVIAALGVGGYFGYTNYLAPMMNPYAKLIPEGLKEYAGGANADAFIVYKKNAELEGQLKKLPAEALIANSVNSALVLMKSNPEAMALYVEFSSENEAGLAKKFLEDQVTDPKFPVKLEQKKNVLIIAYGQGEQAFQGRLVDNTNMQRLDKEKLDSQLIFYVNNANMPEANQLLSTFTSFPLTGYNDKSENELIQTAHAQTELVTTDDNVTTAADSLPTATVNTNQAEISTMMMSAFIRDTILYVKLKDGQLSVNLFFNILAKEDLSSSAMVQLAVKELGTSADIEKLYDSALEQFSKSVPDMNRATGIVKMFAPSVNITMALEKLTFSVDISSPLQDLVDLAVKQDVLGNMMNGPKKAQDAAKKAALNNILIAAERYMAANGNYPEKSACVDQMTELAKYFEQGLPADEQGEKEFGDTKCPSGYYYQYFPEKSYYAVWARMELKEDGNLDLTPAQFEAEAKAGNPIMQAEEGDYYVIDESGYSSRPASAQNAISSITADAETYENAKAGTPDDLSENAADVSTVSVPEITPPEISAPVEVTNPVTPKVRRVKTP